MTNTVALKSLLVRRGMTLEQLSEKTGISRVSLSYKINNKREFWQSEIVLLQEVLQMSDEERNHIFLGSCWQMSTNFDKLWHKKEDIWKSNVQ